MKHLYSIIAICSISFFLSCGGDDYHGIELIEEIPIDNGIVISDSTKNEENTNKQEPDSDNDTTTYSGEKKYLLFIALLFYHLVQVIQ